jgi:hypothetical protein
VSNDDEFEVRNAEVEADMKAIGGILAQTLPKGWRFSLLIASVGEGGSTFYISNVVREDAVALMKEFIEKQEGKKGVYRE